MRAVKSLLFWSYMCTTCVVLFLVALLIWALTLPFDPRKRILHRFTCWWGYHYVRINPFWRPKVIGREKIPEDGCFVIQSLRKPTPVSMNVVLNGNELEVR